MRYVQSPYHSSRNGKKIVGVVIHTTVGGYESTIRYFQNNAATVSAHYVTSLDGSVCQMVQEDRAAHHAGNVDRPTYKQVTDRPGQNPNEFTIGIENADDNNPAGADRTKQYPTLIKLVAEICARHNIPVDREHICGHREIRASKTCPGNLDVDYIVREVRKLGQSMPGQLPENYPQIIHKATQWDATVAKYLPDQRPEDATFEALQRMVAGIQSTITSLDNQLKKKTEETARIESEVANRIEQVSRREAQLASDEKAKNTEITNLSVSLKNETALREQLEGNLKAKQGEVDEAYKQKGILSNELAVANAKVQNFENGVVDADKKAVFSLLRELLERILSKNKGTV